MTNNEQSESETKRKHFGIKPIGFIRSDLKCREDAPRQGCEGAPNAFIEVLPSYIKALHRMEVGDEIIIISWLHRAGETLWKFIREATPHDRLREYF